MQAISKSRNSAVEGQFKFEFIEAQTKTTVCSEMNDETIFFNQFMLIVDQR